MNLIGIETLWGVRKGWSTPELMAAWDEYTIESWREGWDEACKKAIASWGDDLDVYRFVTIQVDMDKIEAAFEPATVQAWTPPPEGNIAAARSAVHRSAAADPTL